jgi:ribokinase
MSNWSDCPWVLLQNEINEEATAKAIEEAHDAGKLVCLNAAPMSQLFIELLAKVDILIVNEVEGAGICNLLPGDGRVMANLESTGAAINVCTFGKKGAKVVMKDENSKRFSHHEQVRRNVAIVDTVGAGDTFVGFFLGHLIRNQDTEPRKILTNTKLVVEALKRAVVASGLACEKRGAMPSIPDLAVVESELSKLQSL